MARPPRNRKASLMGRLAEHIRRGDQAFALGPITLVKRPKRDGMKATFTVVVPHGWTLRVSAFVAPSIKVEGSAPSMPLAVAEAFMSDNNPLFGVLLGVAHTVFDLAPTALRRIGRSC